MSGPVLQTRGLGAGYGTVQVLHDIDLEVYPGEIVALLGPNGAGKTSLLLSVAGLIPLFAGEVSRPGAPGKRAPHAVARDGVTFVPERNLFMKLSMLENLRVAGVDPREVWAIFPVLEQHAQRRVGSLSGGEQQMLSVGRALASRPKLLMIDELSLGLAPLIVRHLLDVVRRAADDGPGVLLVEQHVTRALTVADRAYVLSRGRVVMSDRADAMLASIDDVTRSYLE
jgi:branched-chain amino acid transport system ATP-binding protein